MSGANLVFYGTTGIPGTAEGQSQPSPAGYLGDWRASQVLHSLQSTLTASQGAQGRHFAVDASQIGAGTNVHRYKWLVMMTGPSALAAARVERFDSTTGTYTLDRPLPAAAASGNTYRLCSRNNVWPDVSAAQAAVGEVRYRCICFRNEHGSSLANLKIYFRDLSAGVADCDRFHQNAQTQPFLARANDVTDLFKAVGQRDPAGGADAFGGSGPWTHPLGYATADTLIASLANNTTIAIWLRRVIPAGVQFRRSVGIQLLVESTTGGSDPSPLAASVVLPYDVAADAAVPAGALAKDRYVHVGGGARLGARVTRGSGPEANRAVRWALRPGDAGSIATDDDPLAGYATTDADGLAAATYRAPELEATAGLSAAARLFIGAGDEIGDPQARVSLSATATFAFAGAGDLGLPALVRTEDEDPGAGYWAA